MRLLSVFILSLLFSAALWASVSIDEQQAYLSVDGYQIHPMSLITLNKAIQLKQTNLSEKQLLESSVQNYLLAKTALQELHTEEIDRARQQAQGEYRALLKLLAPAIQGKQESLLVQPFNLDAATLGSIFTKTKTLRSSIFQLNPGHQKLAMQTTLLSYQLGARKKSISLWQLYNNESVQGKAEFINGNMDFIKKLATTAMENDQLQFFRESVVGLSSEELEQIYQVIFNKQLHRAYMHHSGLAADVHHENEMLTRTLSRIDDAAVKSTYEKRKSEFVQVATARARHITLASQQQADQVMAELKAGLDFEKAVIKFSLSDDKILPVPGDLGLIKRGARNLSFAQKIALLSPAGPVKQSYREPGGKSWQIIQVDNRTAEPLPISDSGVYRQIQRQLALELLETEMHTFKQNLIKQADIQISPDLASLQLFTGAE